MITLFKKFYKNTLNSLQIFYKIARGVDYKILNYHIMKINQEQDIDSIIYQLSSCLHYILDYEFFAFAVYDKEYNGGVDIWMDPRTYNMSIVDFIKKDFLPQNVYCNIRCFENTVEHKDRCISDINLSEIISCKIMDNQSRALLYILPHRTLFSYHNELLDIIVKNISASLSNFINMKKLENAALIDPLTNCYNRRALNGYIDHDIANSERYGSNLSAIMFDIDHFKRVNDRYGHKAGDVALRAVSRSVLSAIRKSDYLARYGGEEFILVLPDTKFSKAIELAERLRKITENLQINYDGSIINITASFGVTTYKKGTSRNRFFERADEMLYEAKRQGRNRIKPDLRLYHPISSPFFPEHHEETSF